MLYPSGALGSGVVGRGWPGRTAEAYFGGPDRPPCILRDLLEEKVDAVPPGGDISIICYYFRDEALAEALIRARRRGVRVAVAIEAAPKVRRANDTVRAMLEGEAGLGAGFRAVSQPFRAHLHAKIYYFSHPRPAALVGSFNPSGSALEDAEITRRIGDQDRGHNVLVELTAPGVVAAIADHAAWLHQARRSPLERLGAALNAEPRAQGFRLYYFPRRDSRVLDRILSDGDYDRIRIAASHVRDRTIVRTLGALSRSGTLVEMIAHHTPVRVPRRIERALERADVAVRRYVHPDELPMHAKFMLLEGRGRRHVLFGSLNLTKTSRWLNQEILVQSDDAHLFRSFDRRWDEIGAGALAEEPPRAVLEAVG